MFPKAAYKVEKNREGYFCRFFLTTVVERSKKQIVTLKNVEDKNEDIFKA